MSDIDENESVELGRRNFVQATGAGVAGLAAGGIPTVQGQYEASWDDPEEVLKVLYLGGVEDGALHYSEVLVQELTEYLLQRGIEAHYTERQNDLNPETLANYDAVMLYGNRLEATEEQIDALESFVEDGGGFVPVHSASASFTGDFGDTPDDPAKRYVNLVGGAFEYHGEGVMTTDRIDHEVFEGVEEIEAYEETYRHYDLADDIQVLATGSGADYEEDEGEPFTWVREQGDGRVFYTAWGHGIFEEISSYDEAEGQMNVWLEDGFKQLLENGIRWASGNGASIGSDHPTLEDVEYTPVGDYDHDEVPYYQGEAPDTVSSKNDGTWDLVQDPMDVSDSLAHTITPAEFEMEYFVSEETLPDGVEGDIMDMTFDAQGRCWISVTQDYPNSAGEGNDSIVICEDTDDDGIADEFTVFADGLSIPLSIIACNDGVLVSEVQGFDTDGRVVYLGDEDGDDVADVEETLFTGFGTGDTHAGLNQLWYGHDNWVYGVVGYAGLDPDIEGAPSLSQDLFRFKPDGSEIEHIGDGASNMAGVKTNEEGLVFCSSATAGSNVTTYAAIPSAYYDYINNYEGDTTVDIRTEANLSRMNNENRILPINDRYRQVDQQDGFTAATEQEFYTAREFPEQYWNRSIFVGEATGQLMATFFVEQDGAGYESNYPHNLVGSNDEWVSPTYANTGPDGMVWMIDFYNYIIQHNPDPPGYDGGEGNAYESNVREAGDAYGRLYRVTTSEDIDPHPMDLSDASADELVEALCSDVMFWRLTAQRKLVERGETDVVPDLIDLLETENIDEIGLDPGAIHAIWTLDGLGVLEEGETVEAEMLTHADPEDLEDVSEDVDHVTFWDTEEINVAEAVRGALTHESAGARLNAARALPGSEATRDAILENDFLEDEDWRIGMWALLKLAETPESDDAGAAIFSMIDDEDRLGDDLLVDAASVGAATHSQGFIDAYEDEYGDPDENESGEGVNILENSGIEDVETSSPDGWETNTFANSVAEYTYDDTESYSGERSIRIDSDEGADAVWFQTVEVEPDTEYTLSGHIKTEDVEVDDGYGAFLNIHQQGQEARTDVVTGTEGWTEVEYTFENEDEELQVNAVLGGFGTATGIAWYDDISLVEAGDDENLLANGGFEEGNSEPSPTGWGTQIWGGDAEFTLADAESNGGEYSLHIDSEGGLDGAWNRTVDVEPNTEYTLRGFIKTENVDPGDGYGAAFNAHELGQGSLTEPVTGTEDWTEVEVTIDSGEHETLQINAVLGGWGEATGTAYYDDVRLIDPKGEAEPPNLLSNPSFEEVGNDEPEDWDTHTWGGNAEFSIDDSNARTGEYSIRIDSEEGLDGAWNQTVDVEPYTDYTLRGSVKTDNIDDGSGEGVFLNAHELSRDARTESVTGTQDWTEVEGMINSGDNHELQINAVLGGWGEATGTAWFDDVALQPLEDLGEGIDAIYGRVEQHLEGENGSGGNEPDALDPLETIELNARTSGWTGQAPASIEEAENPTLQLREGEEYTIEWTNLDGGYHNFEITTSETHQQLADNSETLESTDFLNEEGATATLTFTATAEMAGYDCQPHAEMSGEIEIVEE